MAEQNKTEEEPSIEEILASIRQIISDDDEEAKPAEAAPAPEPEPEPAVEEEIVSFPEEEEDILELNQPVEDPVPEPMEVDLMDHEEEAPAPAPEPPPAPAPKPREPDAVLPPMEDFEDEALFTRNVESTAYSAISGLAAKAAVERHGGRTIEDVVRDELRPMLRQWLDKNLPPLIERLVQDELERVTKRVLGDLGE